MNSKFFDYCRGSTCSVSITCPLRSQESWSLYISGDNASPIAYTITSKTTTLSVATLTSESPKTVKITKLPKQGVIETEYAMFSLNVKAIEATSYVSVVLSGYDDASTSHSNSLSVLLTD
jgi:hypothetical protein